MSELMVSPVTPMDQATRLRLDSFIDKTDGCWRWTGAFVRAGSRQYGAFRFQGKTCLAHRVSWVAAGHDLVVGCELDHLCRNTMCVNPDHLEQVSHQENVLRGMAGHHNREKAKTPVACANGHVLTGHNLRVLVTERGGVQNICRACRREGQRKRRAERNIGGHKCRVN